MPYPLMAEDVANTLNRLARAYPAMTVEERLNEAARTAKSLSEEACRTGDWAEQERLGYESAYYMEVLAALRADNTEHA